MAATRSGLHIPSTMAYPTRSSSATIADVDVVSRCRWPAAAIGICDESRAMRRGYAVQNSSCPRARARQGRCSWLDTANGWTTNGHAPAKTGQCVPTPQRRKRSPPNAAKDRTEYLHQNLIEALPLPPSFQTNAILSCTGPGSATVGLAPDPGRRPARGGAWAGGRKAPHRAEAAQVRCGL